MSEFKHILRLEPPKTVSYESLQGDPIECPHCGGNGFFWGKDPVTTESVKYQCTWCKGTTLLVPYVHINWDAPPTETTESKSNS